MKRCDVMGNLLSLDVAPDNEHNKMEQTEEYDPDSDIGNGLILSHYHLPEEVLGHILSFVDEKSLVFNCRFVCRIWRDVVQQRALKDRAERLHLALKPHQALKLQWSDYYWLLRKKPLGRNLLKNNCGKNAKKHWTIISNGGDGWRVEKTPCGAEGLPPTNSKGEAHPDFMGHSSCFVTSFYSCSKEQIINLREHGLTNNFMDHVQPPIHISEWTACRFDCGSIYELDVTLLDEKRQVLGNFQYRENFSEKLREKWYQVTHIFQDYGPGVRYVKFYHGGVDQQFWKGHYGSKMSGGSVRVCSSLHTISWDSPDV
ncbi:F-box only protein 44-like [Ischnura elegans]|uniref:F-box only protein 44-like n=1 Tax=Ischnura elegans TaxID=197161 RepID=UPI001ED87582|nr:F-box only protein 44-like [Ischnura elegans]